MFDPNVRPVPAEDDVKHINTNNKGRSRLGRFLSLGYNTGEPIKHPLLGNFRTVENLWWYLNTGGNNDQIRNMEPHFARSHAKLARKFSCNMFSEVITDAIILKLEQNSFYRQMFTDNQLPFDHYFLNSGDLMPIRPGYASLYVGILDEVSEIMRGDKEYQFVRFIDLDFKPL